MIRKIFTQENVSRLPVRPGLVNRVREFEDENYFAYFINGWTQRWRFVQEPIKPLKYPEFYDVAINNKCHGHCSYCYIEALPTGRNYDDIILKAEKFFGSMTLNQRPFQIAVGGAGEPTLHPEFPEFMEAIRKMQIVVNYTTNGMHLGNRVLDATVKFAGGVAVTAHFHLKWERAVEKLLDAGVETNLHLIPMTDDMTPFREIINKYSGRVKYFVILPYQAVGFGKPIDNAKVNSALFEFVESLPTMENIAWGAYFYNDLKGKPQYNLSLYRDGVFGKYLDMDGNMSLYRSSFEWDKPIQTNIL